jgi:tol-pal system protein YbgF
MLRLLFLLVNCALIFALTGCLLPQQQLQFQSDIQSLDQRVRNIEQQPPAKIATATDSGQLNNIGRQQANLKAELDSLRVDMQALTGRQEAQQHSLVQLREELNLAQNDLSLKVSALENKVTAPALAATVPAVPQNIPPAPAVVPVPQPTVIPATASSVAPIATVPPPSVLPADDAEDEAQDEAQDEATLLYQQALELVQQSGDFTRARTLFEQFLQQYPAHDLSVNAMYWIGESYYGDKKYESAILQLQDVIQKYPDHAKVPAALMKQGLAFYALGDVANARVILQKVIDQYPQTPEAEKAQQRLSTW